MKKLICTVGLPYSGKTTWALEQKSPIVCPDAIRLAIHGHKFIASAEPYIWAIAKTMVVSLFHAGHNTIILDACNTSYKKRDEWLEPDWMTRFHLVKTTENECVRRAKINLDQEILPIITKMAGEITWPIEENK